MRRTRPLLMLGALLATTVPALAGNCEVCHGDKGVAFRRSVHQDYHLYCTDCHGGDKDLPAESLTGDRRTAACADHPSFRGRIEATAVTELCGGCHADTERMNPFRIPTDQLVRYKKSLHGRALYEKGDANTATCISCHGEHEILRVKDPRSKAHRGNVPATCAGCHEDAARMAPYGLKTDIASKYREGVHGRGLLEERLPGVPTCADCHGVHGAAPPGVDRMEDTCGFCHIASRKAFDEGPHRDALSGDGGRACTTCHDPHRTREPDASWFLETGPGGCLDCHAEGDAGARTAREMHDRIRDLEARVGTAREMLSRARAQGLFVEHERGYLEEARRLLVALQPVTHAVSAGSLREFTVRADGVVAETQASVAAKARVWRDRRIGAILAAGGFLLLALLFHLSVRNHRRARTGGGGRPRAAAEEAP